MAERILGPTGSKRRSRFRFLPLALIVVAAVALFVAGSALAVHDQAFQLDGNTFTSDVTTIGGNTQNVDWESFFTGDTPPALKPLPPNFQDSAFVRDFRTNPGNSLTGTGSFSTADSSTYATGSKDTLPITPGWQCTYSNNVNSKTDLSNVYAASYTTPVVQADGKKHQILYFGLERNDNSGDGNIAFWFLQDNVGCNATTSGVNVPFTGQHKDGDILVVSAFTNGGTVSNVTAYRWTIDAAHPAPGYLNPTPVANGGDCGSPTLGTGDTTCAIVNKPTITVPWLTANKNDGVGHSLRESEFFEGGLDLTNSGIAGKCFSSFTGDTRSSQSLTATIFDFAGGSFEHCGANIKIAPSAVNAVGTAHTFNITISQTNAGVTTPAPDGTHATVTLTDQNNNPITATTDTCKASAAGTVNGVCSVTVNSSTAVVITAHAAADVTIQGQTFHVETDGKGDNSGNAIKRYVDANVTIGPSATNEVGHAHTFTITSTAFPSGTTPTLTSIVPSVSPVPGSQSDTCHAGAGGYVFSNGGNTATCTVTINSNVAGTFTANATANWSFADADPGANPATATVSRSTSGTSGPGGSGAATKAFEDAKVTIAPNATNEINQNHTFTATFSVDTGDGTGFHAASGATCTITLTNHNGAVASPAGPFTGTTNASGQFSATFTSGTAGSVSGHATCSQTVNGVPLTRQTDSSGANSGDATKTFEDARISIAPNAVNEVNAPHTFTVTFTVNRGDGNGFLPESGASCTVTLTGHNGAVPNASTPLSGTTDANGHFSVTFTSGSAGTVTGHATCSKTVNGVPLTRQTNGSNGNSGDATKQFVDAYITIGPAEATNNVGQPHTFVINVFQDDGLPANAPGGDAFTGFGPAPDHTFVTVTFTNTLGSTWQTSLDQCASPNGTIAGSCNVTGSSPTAGTVLAHAAVTFSVGGVSLHRETDGLGNNSGDAIKHFVAGSVSWIKQDNAGRLLGGATFQLCRTNDYDTVANAMGPPLATPVCQTVVDNSPPDSDSTAGQFTVAGLPLGRYTAHETVAPPGYDLDQSTQTVDMVPGNTTPSFALPFVDPRPVLKVTGFGYTNAPNPPDGSGQPDGIFKGTTTYTIDLHNYGTSTAHLTHSNLVVSNNAGMLCLPSNTVDLSGMDIPAAGDSGPISLTCSYDHPSPTLISATLTVNYTTNGVERTASGSPATISYTVNPN